MIELSVVILEDWTHWRARRSLSGVSIFEGENSCLKLVWGSGFLLGPFSPKASH